MADGTPVMCGDCCVVLPPQRGIPKPAQATGLGDVTSPRVKPQRGGPVSIPPSLIVLFSVTGVAPLGLESGWLHRLPRPMAWAGIGLSLRDCAAVASCQFGKTNQDTT